MQTLHGRVNAWRNHTSLEAAITADHVKRDGSAAVDNDQGRCIELERAEDVKTNLRVETSDLLHQRNSKQRAGN